MHDNPRSTHLDLESAAAVLGLPSAAVDALAACGYVAASRGADGALRFAPSDLKAFVARNAENGSGSGLLDRVLDPAVPAARPPGPAREDMKPEELVDLLDERAEVMARRVLMMLSTINPDVAGWTDGQKSKFVQHTRSRFESLLAVAALGTELEESVYEDLRGIGAAAAHSSTDLRRLLVILRMSRDLVVQNAVELADADGRHGGYALSLLLTRILPAMDRISDAISNGYWEALFAS
ncbi:MAG TPA: hypothetical protein VFN68_07250 [Acidimicrobiales bacterium]|nr:hypothetical protein [Acidimicrobiales bacterium]